MPDFDEDFEDNAFGGRKSSTRLSGRSKGSHKEYDSDESPNDFK